MSRKIVNTSQAVVIVEQSKSTSDQICRRSRSLLRPANEVFAADTGAATFADRSGEATIQVNGKLNRYRFGTRVYVAAVVQNGSGFLGTLNATGLAISLSAGRPFLGIGSYFVEPQMTGV